MFTCQKLFDRIDLENTLPLYNAKTGYIAVKENTKKTQGIAMYLCDLLNIYE